MIDLVFFHSYEAVLEALVVYDYQLAIRTCTVMVLLYYVCFFGFDLCVFMLAGILYLCILSQI